MDDNARTQSLKEAQKQVELLLKVILDTAQQYRFNEIVNILVGVKNALLVTRQVVEKNFLGLVHMRPYPIGEHLLDNFLLLD